MLNETFFCDFQTPCRTKIPFLSIDSRKNNEIKVLNFWTSKYWNGQVCVLMPPFRFSKSKNIFDKTRRWQKGKSSRYRLPIIPLLDPKAFFLRTHIFLRTAEARIVYFSREIGFSISVEKWHLFLWHCTPLAIYVLSGSERRP